MWIAIAISINKRRNIPKNILYQVVFIALVAVVWDFVTDWHGWSLDYVIPIACIAAMIAMWVIAVVLNLKFEDYVIYLLVDAVFGIVPTIFLIIGNLQVLLPSLLCVSLSIISFAGMFLFEGKRMMTELRRRLHM